MKITFILPAIGKKQGQKYIGTWKMEPLTIAALKALTPEDIETELFDDRIELINYDTNTNLVMIPVETYTAKRSYFIADQFKKRGISVVMGGYHVTLFPDEAADFTDSIIIGNAEDSYADMIEDFKNNKLKKQYLGKPGYNSISPDKSIFASKKYLPISLVETGRGCCHSCDFCSISSYYGCRYYPRPHKSIMDDIENSSHKYHFFVDDNLFADTQNADCLFEKITPYKIKWAGQGTLSMARDKKLLKKMKKSGCELILIGFESLNDENLRQMNKSVNINADRDELVKRIHDAGIGIYATFVFGYDFDTEKSFEQTVEFSKKHNFHTAAFNHLLPFPGTSLYKRLKEEKRLLYDKWWISDAYHYGELSFEPKMLSAEKTSHLCRKARKEFAAAKTLVSRGFSAAARSGFLSWPLFLAMNINIGSEIDEKMNIPIGENLDELPK